MEGCGRAQRCDFDSRSERPLELDVHPLNIIVESQLVVQLDLSHDGPSGDVHGGRECDLERRLPHGERVRRLGH